MPGGRRKGRAADYAGALLSLAVLTRCRRRVSVKKDPRRDRDGRRMDARHRFPGLRVLVSEHGGPGHRDEPDHDGAATPLIGSGPGYIEGDRVGETLEDDLADRIEAQEVRLTGRIDQRLRDQHLSAERTGHHPVRQVDVAAEVV